MFAIRVPTFQLYSEKNKITSIFIRFANGAKRTIGERNTMISKRLSELRKKKQWSLQFIADQLNIAKSTYAGYESGYRQPSLEAVKELAVLFGTTTDYLLGATDEECPTTELTTVTCHITVDGERLTEDEIIQLVAFIRAKREFEKHKK